MFARTLTHLIKKGCTRGANARTRRGALGNVNLRGISIATVYRPSLSKQNKRRCINNKPSSSHCSRNSNARTRTHTRTHTHTNTNTGSKFWFTHRHRNIILRNFDLRSFSSSNNNNKNNDRNHTNYKPNTPPNHPSNNTPFFANKDESTTAKTPELNLTDQLKDEFVIHPNHNHNTAAPEEPPPPTPASSSFPSSTAADVSNGEILSLLYKHVWPSTTDGKRRTLLALGLMISSKVVNVSVPFWFKSLIDNMTPPAMKIYPASAQHSHPSNIISDSIAHISNAFDGTAAHATATEAITSTLTETTMIEPHLLLVTSIPLSIIIGYGLSRSLASVFREFQSAVFCNVTMNGTKRISVDIFSHLLSLDYTFHLNKQTGMLSKAIDRGVRGISIVCNTMLLSVLPTLIEMVFVLGILSYTFGLSFAACSSGTVLLYCLWTLLITRKRTLLRQTMNTYDNKASAHMIDSLLNYETVKYFNHEAEESRTYGDLMGKYCASAIQVQTSLSLLNMGQNVIFSIGLSAMMYLACAGILAGTMTLGDLVLVNTLLFQLSVPLNFIGTVYREVKLALTDLQTMVQLSKIEPQIQANDDLNTSLRPKQHLLHTDLSVPILIAPNIVFDNVSFAYPENVIANANANHGQNMVLRHISFEIESGSKIAIVGGSGCGKSTILRLLYRFFDPLAGQILLDHTHDIATVDLHAYRSMIGIVPQDIVLFNDTLYNNLKYGLKMNADHTRSLSEAEIEHEITAVCKQAQLDAFVSALPDGYQTMVGERGLKLSGGEKQRVAIARMLLKKCPIVIADEPTSSLDSQTESDILKTIDSVRNHETMIVIAHRLSTIIDSDKILVLENGAIIEHGTHQQLLLSDDPNATYKKMWEYQIAHNNGDEEDK